MNSFLDDFWGYQIGWFEPDRYSHWYTLNHFILLFCLATFIVSMCLIFRKKTEAQKVLFLRIIAVFMIFLELMRMVWRTHSYFGYVRDWGKPMFNVGEIISFTFCAQAVWITTISLLVNNKKWNRYVYNFMFPASILAGILALFVPTSGFNTYHPFYHFSTLQTSIQHGLIMFVPIFLIATGMLRLKFKDIWISPLFVFCCWIIAHLSNIVWDRGFMWTTKFDMVPGFEDWKFPFTIVPLAIMYVPYMFICFGICELVRRMHNRSKRSLQGNI